jgi:hypothetical protein
VKLCTATCTTRRPRAREERIEWFLASIYCTCPVAGDICTGDFYTLASCNGNGCLMPKTMRPDTQTAVLEVLATPWMDSLTADVALEGAHALALGRRA